MYMHQAGGTCAVTRRRRDVQTCGRTLTRGQAHTQRCRHADIPRHPLVVRQNNHNHQISNNNSSNNNNN